MIFETTLEIPVEVHYDDSAEDLEITKVVILTDFLSRGMDIYHALSHEEVGLLYAQLNLSLIVAKKEAEELEISNRLYEQGHRP